MVGVNDKAKGAGPQGRGGGGFSFDDREGGRGRGRGGRDGERGDRRGGKGGGAAYRVVNELSALEKALTKADYAAQKQSLDDIVMAVKGLRLKSLADLDMGSRGKLLTSLMRVARQPKKEPAPTAPAPEASPPAEGATPAEAAPEASAPATPAPPATTWSDVLFTTGLVWAAANEAERADAAFEAAGRRPTAAELASLATPEVPAADERPRRSERRDGAPPRRGERRERPERRNERDPAGSRQSRERRFEPAPATTGDWALDARTFEEAGRTRDAGRLHELNQSYVEASRLYDVGGDLKSALRNAAKAKDSTRITALSAKLTPEEVTQQLEKAEAWELLMELYVQKADFGKVAALYERALQFDQAALAWERAGKLSVARRCYERAKDFAAANRVRDLEVTKLVERGDRLGAATILMGVGRSADAIELLKPLPGPKAYAFMLKLKLNAEAAAFAAEALAKAEAEGNQLGKARWLETLGRMEPAAEAYLAVNRKDRASAMFEQAGQFARAAVLAEEAGLLDKAQALYGRAGDTASVERVKALPRPPPRADRAAQEDEAQSDEVAVTGPASTPEQSLAAPPPAAPDAPPVAPA
jgi:hypothetical protein